MNMIQTLGRWWRQRQLRLAQEKYAQWKAKHEEWLRQLKEADISFQLNPYNRHCAISAAGKMAKYAERVECLLRQP